ncbi:MAG: indolepyruvate oxidoreductase subunit beta [Acidobacteria bacterium]|uniref:Indolepyruvate oxidoreductase subunit beta n=1 Tax=Candidatus Polarisedimenticola svalbardensis TaxID=2886004 RepID=A0A8J6XTC3_9BACT|nr:indolepyruvate oxidoreductase subunit beta [Candidatus Polarisedimenticola svalbardensis]
MRCDIVLAGVGGQGVLSIGAIIAAAALEEGLYVKQSEVHGMSQRGGAVQANLRISDSPIGSDLIPKGRATMILSMEPMESLRYLEYLSPEGTLITSSKPVLNIAKYPDLDEVLDAVRKLPHSILVDADRLAREAGAARSTNMVIVGAAAGLLPIEPVVIERFILKKFRNKGDKVVDINLKAFRAGREAAVCTPT